MGDWLGTGTIAKFLRKYRPFKQAKNFARGLGLKNQKEWRDYTKGKLPGKPKLPEDIPAAPDQTYKGKGWAGMGDWLGTGNIAKFLLKYRPFKQARAYTRSLKLVSAAEWRNFTKGDMPGKGKLPEDRPVAPDRTYKKNGWVSWGDWLGTGTIALRLRKYRSFKQARKFARGLGLASESEWRKYTKGQMPGKGKLPEDIPANPNQTYKGKGWDGLGDWLGTGTIAWHQKSYRPFNQGRKFARNLGLKNQKEWYKYTKGKLLGKPKLPEDIPANPNQTYKDKGWVSLGDWLGTGTIAPRLRKFRSFKQARSYARSLKLAGQAEWFKFTKGKMLGKGKLPKDIPTHPDRTYKKNGWISWYDWLGKKPNESR